MNPTKSRMAYVAWTNTDNTEGRGAQVPLAVCDFESTARRLGARRYVQGSDCPVEQSEIFLINNRWYGPINLVAPSNEDREVEAYLRAAEAALAAKMAVIEKAKALGLSEEDIAILKG